MLGAGSASAVTYIKQYVLKYGDEKLNDYFRMFLFPELNPVKDAAFQEVTRVTTDEQVFVAGIDEMFEMKLGKSYEVLASNRSEYLKGFFRQLYDESITINRPGDSPNMHLCVYVPLYQKEFWIVVKEFLEAIEAIPQSYRMDLFLLPYDTAFLFEPKAVQKGCSSLLRCLSAPNEANLCYGCRSYRRGWQSPPRSRQWP